MKKIFIKVVKLYNLGSLIKEPEVVTGGITNKVYKIETSKGMYIVKILSKNDIDRIENSELIADLAFKNNINSLCSLKLDKHVNTIDNYNVIVYPFYEGKILLTKELTLSHVKLLANSLARLHKIKVLDNNIKTHKYEKEDFKALYELTLEFNNKSFDLFKENYNKFAKIYDEVYSSYLKLSNQKSYVHKDLNRKNVLWKEFEFKIIDWETAKVDNPSIDFFNSAWFLTNDIQEDKFKVFIKEYFSIMSLEDTFEIGVKASIIEECNWLAFSLKRALKLITKDKYEINLGLDSIESSLNEILNYYSKIDLMLRLLNENNNNI